MNNKLVRINNVVYRKANFDDISEITDVFIETLIDYSSRMNFQSSTPKKSEMEKFYFHAMSTGDFYVAILDEQIVAFSGSIIREKIWFLSAFWVKPRFQNSGIGFSLLQNVYKAGIKREASTFFVYSSLDYPAIVSYMKLRMYPGYPVFSFEGTLKKSNDLLNLGDYEFKELKKEIAQDLDLEIRGARRSCDHEYWKSIGSKPKQIEKNDQIIGYYYINKEFIGPLVSKKKENIEMLLTIALNDAVKSNPKSVVNVMIPGINHIALETILSYGLKIKSSAYFLTSALFGKLENYLPSGAGLY